MIVRLTASCNNRCFFCMVEDEIARRAFRPFVDIAAEIDTAPPDEEIDIFGGEPTIDPVFWSVLEHALKTGRRVTLASNVRLFSHRPSAERLWALGGSQLIIRTSLMGHTAELHDKLNGVRRNAFRQTIEGIKNLSDVGFDLQTNIVILAENVDHLLSTALAALEAGSRQIKFAGTIRTGSFLASIPDPAVVRERLRTLVPLLQTLGASVSLEKLPPCLAADFLDVLSRESDPAAESQAWFKKVDACQRCSLVMTCQGGERGALERYGEGWVQPITALPPRLVEEVPFESLETYLPRKEKPFVRVLFDLEDEGALAGAISSISVFASRYPQIHLIA